MNPPIQNPFGFNNNQTSSGTVGGNNGFNNFPVDPLANKFISASNTITNITNNPFFDIGLQYSKE
jgi:hypothetical protein